MSLAAPPVITTPPSAGGSPTAPGAVFAPPAGGGSPTAPGAVFAPPSAGGSPTAPGAVFAPPAAGVPVDAVATITVPENSAMITDDAGIQINGVGTPIGPINNKTAQFLVDNIIVYYFPDLDFSVEGNVITVTATGAGAAGNAWTLTKFGTGNNLILSDGFSGGSDSGISPPPAIFV
jgi:hypothetical protein